MLVSHVRCYDHLRMCTPQTDPFACQSISVQQSKTHVDLMAHSRAIILNTDERDVSSHSHVSAACFPRTAWPYTLSSTAFGLTSLVRFGYGMSPRNSSQLFKTIKRLNLRDRDSYQSG